MKYTCNNNINEKKLTDRFVSYAKMWTTSNEKLADKGISPSTPRQRDFAVMLANEIKELGLKNVQVTENSFVYGLLPATTGYENVQSFCLLAHLDTSEAVSGRNVQPNIITNYDGKKIILKDDVILDPKTDKALQQAAKEKDTIITSDGTTLLGGDDKAGITAIITGIETIIQSQIKHCSIEVLFSPDEETGHGMDNVPLNILKSKKCYTIDGGHIGELETECFNASKADLIFTGVSVHTGNGREGNLVNAITMASAFITNLPRQEAPETTDEYEGFYAPVNISGSIESATVQLILRDFSYENLVKRQNLVSQIAETTAVSFGGKVSTTHKIQYLNMKENLDKQPKIAENLMQAFISCGIQPTLNPIRGGTDGSRLTEMGIPTPNMFTGGHNYHSRKEWVSVSQMAAAADVIIELAIISAEE